MDKQSIIGFILITVVLMVWLYLNSPSPTEQQQQQKPTPTQTDTTVKQQDTKSVPDPVLTNQEKDTVSGGETLSTQSRPEKLIWIENDVARFAFTDQGGKIKRIFLKKYKNWYAADKEDSPFYYTDVQLLNQGTFDLEFRGADGRGYSTGKLQFTTDFSKNEAKISGTDSIAITYTAKIDSQRSVSLRYALRGSTYDANIAVTFNGFAGWIRDDKYSISWKGGIRSVEENSVDEANYSNASVFLAGTQEIVNASGITTPKEDHPFPKGVEWVTVRNKYFTSTLIPARFDLADNVNIKSLSKPLPMQGVEEIYDYDVYASLPRTDSHTEHLTLYMGPVDYDELKAYGNNLESIVDFGSFFGLKFIIRPIAEYILMPVFKLLHSIIPNYGVVIIIFAFLIKLAVYPLTKKSQESMLKMQLLQPKINEIKEKYKEDQQVMNKEVMKLYGQYGVNPAGGCLPILLQMPVFIAMWGVFNTVIELRMQPFLYIQDLSRPDYIFTLPFTIPLVGVSHISLLAILMGITTFLQQKMSVKDPSQKALVYMMPIMLTFLFMSFPSGLNLYYFLFNLLSILQQYLYNASKKDMKLEPVANPKKKAGFMQRMMEAAEKQAKTQQQAKKKK